MRMAILKPGGICFLVEISHTEQELEVTMRSLVSLFEQYVKLNRKIPPELLTTLAGIEDPSRLADTVAAHLSIRLEEKQALLETGGVTERMEKLMGLVEGEIEVLQLEKRIRGRVKTQMEKSQREYYLNEQMKAIQKELGDMDDAPNDMDDLDQPCRRGRYEQGGQEEGHFRAKQAENDVTDVSRGNRGQELY